MDNTSSPAGKVNYRALPALTSRLDDFLERLPEEVPHSSPGVAKSLCGILDPAAVETILTDQWVRPPQVRMVKDGAAVPTTAYANASQITNLFLLRRQLEAGSTLILNNVSYYWRPVAEFGRRLSYELGRHVGVNAYLTPAGAQGHTHHFDLHSSFVVQLFGRKFWRLYRPALSLPLDDTQSGRRNDHQFSEEDRERIYHGEPDMVVELAPGDALWLPRGWIHDVFTRESPSLHLTFGIWEVSGRQIFESLGEMLAEKEEFRTALPLDFSRSAQAGVPSVEEFMTGLRDWVTPIDFDELSRRTADRFRSIRYPPRCQPISGILLTDEDLASYEGIVAIREAVLEFGRLPTGELRIDTGLEQFVLDAAAADVFGPSLIADDARPVPLERYRRALGDGTLAVIRTLLGSGVATLVAKP